MKLTRRSILSAIAAVPVLPSRLRAKLLAPTEPGMHPFAASLCNWAPLRVTVRRVDSFLRGYHSDGNLLDILVHDPNTGASAVLNGDVVAIREGAENALCEAAHRVLRKHGSLVSLGEVEDALGSEFERFTCPHRHDRDENGAWVGSMERRFRALADGTVSVDTFLDPNVMVIGMDGSVLSDWRPKPRGPLFEESDGVPVVPREIARGL